MAFSVPTLATLHSEKRKHYHRLSWRILSTVLLISLVHIPAADSKARVLLNILTFDNPNNLKKDGLCCDGELTENTCSDECEYSMIACLGSSESSPCGLAVVNRDYLNPNIGTDGALGFDLHMWTGFILVTLYLQDVDTFSQDPVDTFQFRFNTSTPFRNQVVISPDLFTPINITGSRTVEPIRMEVAIAARCDQFYYTDRCDINCVPSRDCGGHYSCNSTTGDKVCLAGWGGPNCTTPLTRDHVCYSDELCSRHGICVSVGNTTERFYCCCNPGYRGDKCQDDVNECSSQPCQNGGRCVEENPPTFRCECAPGWKGNFCQTPKTCDDPLCQNGGQCRTLQVFGSYYCFCDSTGFTGDFCERPLRTTSRITSTTTEVTTLRSITSTPDVTTFTSITTASSATNDISSTSSGLRPCHGRYYGPDCLTYCRPADDCSGHYTCDQLGQRICLPGWTQESDCTEPINPNQACSCQNGGYCFWNSCCCPANVTGAQCQDPAVFCHSNPCMNGGTCFEDAIGARCQCGEMFTGEYCQTMRYANRNCPSNYYGPLCDVHCLPQYGCGLETGQYYCDERTGQRRCMFGWIGESCNEPDPNAKHDQPCPNSVCRNSAACINGTCCCLPGYTGTLCHIEILECESSPCLNGGACTDEVNAYKCTCMPGFTGLNCEEDLRDTLPGGSTAAPTTSSSDPCGSTPCQNGGVCLTNGTTSFWCLCSGRYQGDVCENYVPSSSTTANCPIGYYGNDCSVRCVEEDSCVGHYFCNPVTGEKLCRSGWTGDECDQRILSSSTDSDCPIIGAGCFNGGSCFNKTCCCSVAYTGRLCQVEALSCSTSPCGVYGICIDITSDYICQCIVGYSGRHCDIPVTVISIDTSRGSSVSSTIAETITSARFLEYNSGASESSLESQTSVETSTTEQYITRSLPLHQGEQSSLRTSFATSLLYMDYSSVIYSSTMLEASASPSTSCGSFSCFNGGTCDFSSVDSTCKCPRENMGRFCETSDPATATISNVMSFTSNELIPSQLQTASTSMSVSKSEGEYSGETATIYPTTSMSVSKSEGEYSGETATIYPTTSMSVSKSEGEYSGETAIIYSTTSMSVSKSEGEYSGETAIIYSTTSMSVSKSEGESSGETAIIYPTTSMSVSKSDGKSSGETAIIYPTSMSVSKSEGEYPGETAKYSTHNTATVQSSVSFPPDSISFISAAAADGTSSIDPSFISITYPESFSSFGTSLLNLPSDSMQQMSTYFRSELTGTVFASEITRIPSEQTLGEVDASRLQNKAIDLSIEATEGFGMSSIDIRTEIMLNIPSTTTTGTTHEHDLFEYLQPVSDVSQAMGVSLVTQMVAGDTFPLTTVLPQQHSLLGTVAAMIGLGVSATTNILASEAFGHSSLLYATNYYGEQSLPEALMTTSSIQTKALGTTATIRQNRRNVMYNPSATLQITESETSLHITNDDVTDSLRVTVSASSLGITERQMITDLVSGTTDLVSGTRSDLVYGTTTNRVSGTTTDLVSGTTTDLVSGTTTDAFGVSPAIKEPSLDLIFTAAHFGEPNVLPTSFDLIRLTIGVGSTASESAVETSEPNIFHASYSTVEAYGVALSTAGSLGATPVLGDAESLKLTDGQSPHTFGQSLHSSTSVISSRISDPVASTRINEGVSEHLGEIFASSSFNDGSITLSASVSSHATESKQASEVTALTKSLWSTALSHTTESTQASEVTASVNPLWSTALFHTTESTQVSEVTASANPLWSTALSHTTESTQASEVTASANPLWSTALSHTTESTQAREITASANPLWTTALSHTTESTHPSEVTATVNSFGASDEYNIGSSVSSHTTELTHPSEVTASSNSLWSTALSHTTESTQASEVTVSANSFFGSSDVNNVRSTVYYTDERSETIRVPNLPNIDATKTLEFTSSLMTEELSDGGSKLIYPSSIEKPLVDITTYVNSNDHLEQLHLTTILYDDLSDAVLASPTAEASQESALTSHLSTLVTSLAFRSTHVTNGVSDEVRLPNIINIATTDTLRSTNLVNILELPFNMSAISTSLNTVEVVVDTDEVTTVNLMASSLVRATLAYSVPAAITSSSIAGDNVNSEASIMSENMGSEATTFNIKMGTVEITPVLLVGTVAGSDIDVSSDFIQNTELLTRVGDISRSVGATTTAVTSTITSSYDAGGIIGNSRALTISGNMGSEASNFNINTNYLTNTPVLLVGSGGWSDHDVPTDVIQNTELLTTRGDSSRHVMSTTAVVSAILSSYDAGDIIGNSKVLTISGNMGSEASTFNVNTDSIVNTPVIFGSIVASSVGDISVDVTQNIESLATITDSSRNMLANTAVYSIISTSYDAGDIIGNSVALTISGNMGFEAHTFNLNTDSLTSTPVLLVDGVVWSAGDVSVDVTQDVELLATITDSSGPVMSTAVLASTLQSSSDAGDIITDSKASTISGNLESEASTFNISTGSLTSTPVLLVSIVAESDSGILTNVIQNTELLTDGYSSRQVVSSTMVSPTIPSSYYAGDIIVNSGASIISGHMGSEASTFNINTDSLKSTPVLLVDSGVESGSDVPAQVTQEAELLITVRENNRPVLSTPGVIFPSSYSSPDLLASLTLETLETLVTNGAAGPTSMADGSGRGVSATKLEELMSSEVYATTVLLKDTPTRLTDSTTSPLSSFENTTRDTQTGAVDWSSWWNTLTLTAAAIDGSQLDIDKLKTVLSEEFLTSTVVAASAVSTSMDQFTQNLIHSGIRVTNEDSMFTISSATPKAAYSDYSSGFVGQDVIGTLVTATRNYVITATAWIATDRQIDSDSSSTINLPSSSKWTSTHLLILDSSSSSSLRSEHFSQWTSTDLLIDSHTSSTINLPSNSIWTSTDLLIDSHTSSTINLPSNSIWTSTDLLIDSHTSSIINLPFNSIWTSTDLLIDSHTSSIINLPSNSMWTSTDLLIDSHTSLTINLPSNSMWTSTDLLIYADASSTINLPSNSIWKSTHLLIVDSSSPSSLNSEYYSQWTATDLLVDVSTSSNIDLTLRSPSTEISLEMSTSQTATVTVENIFSSTAEVSKIADFSMTLTTPSVEDATVLSSILLSSWIFENEGFSSDILVNLETSSHLGIPVSTALSEISYFIRESILLTSSVQPSRMMTASVLMSAAITGPFEPEVSTISIPSDQSRILGEVFITGPLLPADYSKLVEMITEALVNISTPAVACCHVVSVDESDKYFDYNRNPLVRLDYNFTPSSGFSNPRLNRNTLLTLIDEKLKQAGELRLNNSRVYRGLIIGPEQVFDLDLIGEVPIQTYQQIDDIISSTWLKKNPACGCTYTTNIQLGRKYYGRYGTQLTKIYYTVSKDDNIQLVTSRERPALQELLAAVKTSSLFYGLYTNIDTLPYYNHYEAPLRATITLSSQTGIDTRRELAKVWQRYFQENGQCLLGPCQVSITAVYPETHYTNISNDITNLIYFTSLNDKIITPSSFKAPSLEVVGSLLTPCPCQHHPALSVYLNGYAQYYKALSIIQDIIGNEGKLIRREFFNDMSGNLVTKVTFKPTSFGTELPSRTQKELIHIISNNQASAPDVGIPLKRKYQVVINGQLPENSVLLIPAILRQAWIETNNEISPDDIHISILQMDSDSSVKLDTSPVTIVDYYVTIDQADSSLTIAEEPLMQFIQQKFSDNGTLAACNCEVSHVQNITIHGHFDPSNSSQLEALHKALEDAWREANRNYTGNVKVNIISVSTAQNETTEVSRNQGRTVLFMIETTGAENGITDLDLFQPSNEVINTYFHNNDLDITVSEEGRNNNESSDDDAPFPWYIPVGVILALLLIIVIVLIFCCICWETRKKDSKEIDNNIEDFREDNFDKEHFTMEPVAFENEAFRGIDRNSGSYEVNPDGKTDL